MNIELKNNVVELFIHFYSKFDHYESNSSLSSLILIKLLLFLKFFS
jgi:hypothetical protein